MSQQLISLNPDLKRLQDEGYHVEVKNGHLLVHEVPYPVDHPYEVERTVGASRWPSKRQT